MPDDDPVRWPHKGSWDPHADDCRCTWADCYCNRGGWCWSCCGASKEASDCSAPATHPTYWEHPKHHGTVARWVNHWPEYRSNAEILAIAAECFPAPGA